MPSRLFFFFLQAEDGIRDSSVTGVQTCALPIWVYGGDFVARARGLGIETLLTPVRAPRANAIAERIVRTLRYECFDHLIVVNEAHLRAVVGEYAAYYNAERPHRGLHLEPPLRPR